MSAALDVNILIHASNIRDPSHEPARALIDGLAAGPDLRYLFWPTVMGHLRIPTHPRIWRAHFHRESLGGRGLRRAVSGHSMQPSTWGRRLSDAHIATLMRQHGVRVIYTRDRDFRRFDGIEPRDLSG